MAGVALGMSGGVDSSYSAFILRERGYQVIGIFLDMGHNSEDWQDVKSICERLGLESIRVEASCEFTLVKKYFVDEYAAGNTPNQCVLCNRIVKFDSLLGVANKLGIEYVATGHYAKIAKHEVTGAHLVKRASFRKKDQSYALVRLSRETLSRIILPLGEIDSKEIVIAKVRELGLMETDSMGESQDICFLRKGESYVDYVMREAPDCVATGVFKGLDGSILGTHGGHVGFTIGQRKIGNLACGRHRRLYVVEKDAKTGDVIVGERKDVLVESFVVEGVNWHVDISRLGDYVLVSENETGKRSISFEAEVQIMYQARRGFQAIVYFEGEDRFLVHFSEKVFAVTVGTSAVLYVGDYVLGGGRISELL